MIAVVGRLREERAIELVATAVVDYQVDVEAGVERVLRLRPLRHEYALGVLGLEPVEQIAPQTADARVRLVVALDQRAGHVDAEAVGTLVRQNEMMFLSSSRTAVGPGSS